MNIPIDVSTIVSGLTVLAVAWAAKFLRRVDIRLTKIETHLKLKDSENV